MEEEFQFQRMPVERPHDSSKYKWEEFTTILNFLRKSKIPIKKEQGGRIPIPNVQGRHSKFLRSSSSMTNFKNDIIVDKERYSKKVNSQASKWKEENDQGRIIWEELPSPHGVQHTEVASVIFSNQSNVFQSSRPDSLHWPPRKGIVGTLFWAMSY